METFHPDSRSLARGVAVQLGSLATRVSSVRSAHRGLIVAVEGVDSREGALALLGQVLRVARSALPPLPPGEHYLADLVGFTAVSPQGALLGTISGERVGTPQPLLVLESGGREALVPAVPGILLEVDSSGRRVTLDLPPGLLDLYRSSDKGIDKGK